MWCRPPRQSSTSAPFPFTERDGEPSGAAVLSSDGDYRPDWSRILHLVPVQKPHVRGVVLEDGTVLLDPVTQRCFRLNRVETVVWEHCTGAATLQQIHHAVSVRLELPYDDLREQIIACVVQWSHDGLLDRPGGQAVSV